MFKFELAQLNGLRAAKGLKSAKDLKVWCVALAGIAGLCGAAGAKAQEITMPVTVGLTAAIMPVSAYSSSGDGPALAANQLPDAPGFISESVASESVDSGRAAGGLGGGQTTPVVRHANKLDKVVDPGYATEKLTIGDKILLGIKENATVSSVAGWVINAGYEQAVNSSPNYGQTGKGFAQRLGAAAARNSSENIFSDSVIASVLHEDPRYYKLGSGHSFIKRLVYSGTRGLITRTDGGRQTINFANVGGDLGGAALTQLYYPPINRNFTQVMSTWGSSVGGDAIGYVVDEFLTDALTTLHLKKSQ